MARRNFGRELWERMCAVVADDDGLSVTPFKYWTAEKLFFVCQYLAQTTTAMWGNPRFRGLNYIDLFCGNGVCEVYCEERVRRYPGSALLAAGCQKPFSNLFLVDKDAACIEALRTRITRLGSGSHSRYWTGDANAVISDVCAQIPPKSLSVAFLDPWSLGVHFETIRELAADRAVDLIILFPDAMDIARNVDKDYYPRKSNKLDLVLGEEEDWRPAWDRLDNREAGKCREFFANLYQERLAKLGYRYTDSQEISAGHRPIYRLVYASKNELGLKFWRIAAREDLYGNKGLFDP